MPRAASARPCVGFVEHIAVDARAGTFGEALQQLKLRLERSAVGRPGAVRVTSVRRMAAPEVAGVQLEPATCLWFEVRGDLPPPNITPLDPQRRESPPESC